MDGIKRTAHSASQKTSSAMAHRTVQKSTTLNRKFVKKPVAKKTQIIAETKARQNIRSVSMNRATSAAAARTRNAAMIQRGQRVKLSPIAKAQAQTQPAKQQAAAAQKAQAAQQKSAHAQAAQRVISQRVSPSVAQQIQANESAVSRAMRAKTAARKQQAEQVHMTSKEMKDRAISDALRKVSSMDKAEAKQQKSQKKAFWQKSYFAAALSFAVVSVALLGYLVYLNLPDLSVRVAAMNSGIENAYPSYVPMNYRLQGLAKEDNGMITMVFARNDGSKFTMIEKKSSWDSSALLNNFVKDNWGDNYTVAKGQGLTIYISGSNAVWVNGGVMYQIEAEESVLSTDDLHDIAISL